MFEDSLFVSAGKLKSGSPMTVVISFLLQSIAVGIMILIPLVYTEALPGRQMISMLMTPPPPPAQRPIAATSPPVRVMTRPVRQQQELRQPVAIPDHAAILQEDLLPPAPVVGYVDQSSADVSQVAGDFLSAAITIVPPPPPPPLPERIKVGGQVAAARLVYQPQPVYPPLARQARIQGTVRLEAVINKQGQIEELTVVSGHPMLIQAALDAVSKWQYEPTMLNGVPVEVITTIDVNFTMGR